MSTFLLSAALLITNIGVATASESPFVFGPEEIVPKSIRPGDPWEEGRVTLPAWPNDQDLIPIPLDQPDARFTYSIDRNSLQTGENGVVRYTLVAENPSGTRNTSFEGIRCTPRGAFKRYAYGQDRRFIATEGADWQPINVTGTDPARQQLWRHYLCVPRLFEPRPKKQQLRMLRSGRVPSVESSGFLTN
jgi:hypothetical protein